MHPAKGLARSARTDKSAEVYHSYQMYRKHKDSENFKTSFCLPLTSRNEILCVSGVKHQAAGKIF